MSKGRFASILFLAWSVGFFLVPEFRQGLVWPLVGQFGVLRLATGMCSSGH